jgi:hypothetical protein
VIKRSDVTFLAAISLEGRKAAKLPSKTVGISADGVRSITIIGALAVKAQVIGRRHEERLEQIPFGLLVQFGGHVEQSAGHGHGPSEAQEPGKPSTDINYREKIDPIRHVNLTPTRTNLSFGIVFDPFGKLLVG